MCLGSFYVDGAASWGLIEGDVALDIGAQLRHQFAYLKDVLRKGATEEIRRASASAQSLSHVAV
jgi:hypothetical protein